MSMYSLIEDAQNKALELANCWHETDEARELIAKVDAFEVLADRWYGECQLAAKGFTEAAQEIADQLDGLRDQAVIASAEALSGRAQYLGPEDNYDDAWMRADDEAPSVKYVIQSARRAHAGDNYLQQIAA